MNRTIFLLFCVFALAGFGSAATSLAAHSVSPEVLSAALVVICHLT